MRLVNTMRQPKYDLVDTAFLHYYLTLSLFFRLLLRFYTHRQMYSANSNVFHSKEEWRSIRHCSRMNYEMHPSSIIVILRKRGYVIFYFYFFGWLIIKSALDRGMRMEVNIVWVAHHSSLLIDCLVFRYQWCSFVCEDFQNRLDRMLSSLSFFRTFSFIRSPPKRDAAVLAIIDPHKRVLLCKRPEHMKSYPGDVRLSSRK